MKLINMLLYCTVLAFQLLKSMQQIMYYIILYFKAIVHYIRKTRFGTLIPLYLFSMFPYKYC